MTPETLSLDDLPQLRLLLWNRPGAQSIDAALAFAVYETNGRFVEVDRLTPAERRVIDQLTTRFGAGLLNVRACPPSCILRALGAMDADDLRDTACSFGGGTAIVLQRHGYRESVVAGRIREALDEGLTGRA